jgi:hypothetical protein
MIYVRVTGDHVEGDISLTEVCTDDPAVFVVSYRLDVVTIAPFEVVYDSDLLAVAQEFVGEMSADKTCPPGY